MDPDDWLLDEEAIDWLDPLSAPMRAGAPVRAESALAEWEDDD